MNTTFGQHIINILRQQDCVVLPNIGGLVLKDINAHIYEGQIFPAGKTVRFNKFIQGEDDLLISELMNIENFSYADAKTEVEKFIGGIKFQLTQNNYCEIEYLGRFSHSDEGGLKFLSIANLKSLDKNNYGLESFQTFKIQREIIKVDTKTKVIPLVIEEKETIKGKSLHQFSRYGLVATMLLMLGIFSLILTNTTVDQIKVQNANVLNFFVHSKSDTNKYVGNLRTENTQQENNKKKKKKKKKTKKSKALEVNKNDIIIEDINGEISPELKDFSENLKNSRKEKIEETVEHTSLNEENEITKEPSIEKNTTIGEDYSKQLADVLKVNSDNPKGFYIVIGAYSSIENANKAKYNCSIDNTCKVFKTASGMYRVAIFSSEDVTTAFESIKTFKKTNSSYWLMQNN